MTKTTPRPIINTLLKTSYKEKKILAPAREIPLHYTRVAKICKTDLTRYSRKCGTTRPLSHCRWELTTGRPFWKRVLNFLEKVTTHLSDASGEWYLAKTEWSVHRYKDLNAMFVAALPVIAKSRKQLEYPSTGEQINAGIRPYDGIFLGNKKVWTALHSTPWMNVTVTTLSERGQTQKSKLT